MTTKITRRGFLASGAAAIGAATGVAGCVSGAWWGGNYQEFPPAYVVVDLYDDGSSEGAFVPWSSESGRA